MKQRTDGRPPFNPGYNVSPVFGKKKPAFVMAPDMKMPAPGENKWTQERLDQLLQWPAYKIKRDKDHMLPPHMRNNSPMTMYVLKLV